MAGGDWEVVIMKIIQNAIKILEDSTNVIWLNSRFTHDFIEYRFKNGQSIAVDGGTEYIKRAGDFESEGKLWEDWSLTDEDSIDKIVEKLLWGTRGKSGKEPAKYLPLSSLTKEHLRAILAYEYPPNKCLSSLQKDVITKLLLKNESLSSIT